MIMADTGAAGEKAGTCTATGASTEAPKASEFKIEGLCL